MLLFVSGDELHFDAKRGEVHTEPAVEAIPPESIFEFAQHASGHNSEAALFFYPKVFH